MERWSNVRREKERFEDNMKLCFIHITFILGYVLCQRRAEIRSMLLILTIIKHEFVCMMHGLVIIVAECVYLYLECRFDWKL